MVVVVVTSLPVHLQVVEVEADVVTDPPFPFPLPASVTVEVNCPTFVVERDAIPPAVDDDEDNCVVGDVDERLEVVEDIAVVVDNRVVVEEQLAIMLQ